MVAVDTREMRLIRRISSAFRDIRGGQILGPTFDYAHRLLDFDLRQETPAGLDRGAKMDSNIEYSDRSCGSRPNDRAD